MVAIYTILVFMLVKSTQAKMAHRKDVLKTWKYSTNAHNVLKLTIRTYYEAGLTKISPLKEMRFMFEESPHYEQGYVLGEIIERYRKSVEHVQQCFDFKSNTVMDNLKKTELLQKLHFEIYHLCNMLHEIGLKYQSVPEFRDQLTVVKKMTKVEAWDFEKHLKQQQKKRRKDKKRRLKELRKLQETLAKRGEHLNSSTGLNKIVQRWWPLDYGWEIDYYW